MAIEAGSPIGAVTVVEDSPAGQQSGRNEGAADGLRGRTIRGATVSGLGQAASLILRTASMIVLARLLFPRDFGLFGMVTAVTGFLSIFRDFGLQLASITRVTVTDDQLSALFWINAAIGALLAVLCAASAPALVSFYKEPQLLSMTFALAAGFLLNGVVAQHRAILIRDMRFGVLTLTEMASLTGGAIVAVAMALRGSGYWALVAMTIVPQGLTLAGCWYATGWVPSRPKRRNGIRPMLQQGATVTVNGLVMYLAYNVDKVLVGRLCGAEALGLYGRAYQLINIPVENLNGTVAQVAFPALARIQTDGARLRSYFLQGYGLFVAAAVPLTVACALFAPEIVLLFLGPKWTRAVPIFQLLTPTVLAFAVINPFCWLLMSTGASMKSLKIAVAIAPCIIAAFLFGVRFGPEGVAFAFSAAMLALTLPVVAWARQGTLISGRDIVKTAAPPILSSLMGAIAVFAVKGYLQQIHSSFARLVAETGILLLVYSVVLLFALKQHPVYLRLVKDLRFRSLPCPVA